MIHALVTNPDDNWLLVRHGDDDWWRLPGGIALPGELPTEACRRLVAEQIELRLPIGGLHALECMRIEVPEPVIRYTFVFVMSLFAADEISPPNRASADSTAGWRWARPDEAIETLLAPCLRTCLQARRWLPPSSIYIERGLDLQPEGRS
jgi:ADP-ribose pyrophosphatase YjhB (NUDIX family)